MLRRPIEFVRARRPFHGLEVRDGVGLFPGFPERLRAAAGFFAAAAGAAACALAAAAGFFAVLFFGGIQAIVLSFPCPH